MDLRAHLVALLVPAGLVLLLLPIEHAKMLPAGAGREDSRLVRDASTSLASVFAATTIANCSELSEFRPTSCHSRWVHCHHRAV